MNGVRDHARGSTRGHWIPGESLVRARAGAPGEVVAPTAGPRVGVLALQGDVLEHLSALRRCDAVGSEVRTAAQLAEVDALVIPGGESTTIGRLLERLDLLDAVRRRIDAGMPVFGTCAGMILLSDELEQAEDQVRVGGLAVRTRRNAFGRQRDSFDTTLVVHSIDGGPMDVSFIRAPRVDAVLDDAVEVLAEVDGHPVVVRQGNLLASAFHPEITGDDRLHASFVSLVRAHVGSR